MKLDAGKCWMCEESWFGDCITWAHPSSVYHSDSTFWTESFMGSETLTGQEPYLLPLHTPSLLPVLGTKPCLTNDSAIFSSAFQSDPSASPCDSWNTDQPIEGYHLPFNTYPTNCKETVPFGAEVCAQKCLTPNPESIASHQKSQKKGLKSKTG